MFHMQLLFHFAPIHCCKALQTVRREISILWLPAGLFGKSICYLSVGLYIWKMILPHLKSSIPQGSTSQIVAGV